MMLGARTAAWAKSGYTAKDYVQRSIAFQFDWLENQRGGFSSSPSSWHDLSDNGFDLQFNSYADFLPDSVGNNTIDKNIAVCENEPPKIKCLEIVCKVVSPISSKITDIFYATSIGGAQATGSKVFFMPYTDMISVADVSVNNTSDNAINFHASELSVFRSYSTNVVDGGNLSNAFVNGVSESLAKGYGRSCSKGLYLCCRSSRYSQSCPLVRVKAIRGYTDNLTIEEQIKNNEIDAARFNLP